MSNYIEWLKTYGVNNSYDKNNEYNLLFTKLHNTPFVSIVNFDGNRIYEALEIRQEYLREVSGRVDINSEDDSCTMLELLISLSIRAEEMTFESANYLTVYEWFWRLLDNLGLSYMKDEHFETRKCDTILFRLIDRKYSKDGKDGLFPLEKANEDQRKVELWYQLSAYINERF